MDRQGKNNIPLWSAYVGPMQSMFCRFAHLPWPKLGVGLTAASLALAPSLWAQDTPLLSGGVGFFTSSNQRGTTYLPIAEPLLVAPLGSRVLLETRAALTESVTPKSGPLAGYNHSFFAGLTYLQGDIIATPHMNFVAGSFLIPFGTYNERLSPVWINNLQDGPLIANLGTMGTGTGVGAQVRGSAYSSPKVSLTYAAYYSARSGNQQFNSEHSFGGRSSLYFKPQRVEVGLSYGRLLQGTHENFYGMHIWFEPKDTGLRLRSEFARGHHAQGYWMEADYRTTRPGARDSWAGRLEPVLRFQQTWRRDQVVSDGLPLINTQRFDAGLNYNLPHNTRIMTSFARQFSATADGNIWETGIVYRFLTPAWKGQKK